MSTGRYNVAVGYESMQDITSADHNTAVGNFLFQMSHLVMTILLWVVGW